jgi:hypothetical protein
VHILPSPSRNTHCSPVVVDESVSIWSIGFAVAVTATREIGSSTAVLAKLDNETLKTTNLGDSGYVLYSYNKNGINLS